MTHDTSYISIPDAKKRTILVTSHCNAYSLRPQFLFTSPPVCFSLLYLLLRTANPPLNPPPPFKTFSLHGIISCILCYKHIFCSVHQHDILIFLHILASISGVFFFSLHHPIYHPAPPNHHPSRVEPDQIFRYICTRKGPQLPPSDHQKKEKNFRQEACYSVSEGIGLCPCLAIKSPSCMVTQWQSLLLWIYMGTYLLGD